MCTSFSGQDFEIQRIEPENWLWRDLKTSKIEKMKDFGGVPCEIDISLLPDISCFIHQKYPIGCLGSESLEEVGQTKTFKPCMT